MAITIQSFFDKATATFSYVVHDQKTHAAAIIDAVLNYDPASGCTSTQSADAMIAYIEEKKLKLAWILETHIHADHITAAHYLKTQLGGRIGLGEGIKEVADFWVPLFHMEHAFSQGQLPFDHFFHDNETVLLGSVPLRVMATPGHTPACVSYLIEDAAFIGDTLFMTDIGTARTDFPGGSAQKLYHSIQKLLALDPQTRLFLCHDYPPSNRALVEMTTVAMQRAENCLIHEGVTEEAYVKARTERDRGKAVPSLLLPSIQMNLRAGDKGPAEANGRHYLKIPLDVLNS